MAGIAAVAVAGAMAPAATAGPAVFTDAFEGSALSSARWHIPTWTGPGDGTYVGRTQFRVSQNSPLPPVAAGNVRISVQSFNPTGFSFYGTDLIGNKRFSVGRGLRIAVRAKLGAPPRLGTVAGIFLYSPPATGTNHDEIDFELLGNHPDRVQTNVYADAPLGAGDPTSTPFATGSATDYHLYEIEWLPDRVSWFVDGTLIRTETGQVPTGPMDLHLNMWVPDVDWAYAYDAGFQPASVEASNQTFAMSVDSVIITAEGTDVTRVAGTDRYRTAVAVSEHAFPTGAPAAVVACGADFPDALTAAPLANAVGGPVLLTPRASLPASVTAELKRLAPSRVFVVGSTGAVSSKVASEIAGLPSGPHVERLGGIDRFETAALIAGALRGERGTPSRAVLVNGYGFADALAAAPLAAARGWPILLATKDKLPRQTADAIASSEATGALVVGSTGVVSDGVMHLLPSPVRKGGSDRYETCVRVADFAETEGCSYRHVGLATGAGVPDALACGPLLARDAGLLLLTPPSGLPAAAAARISAHKAEVADADVVGGSGAVTQVCVTALVDALR